MQMRCVRRSVVEPSSAAVACRKTVFLYRVISLSRCCGRMLVCGPPFVHSTPFQSGLDFDPLILLLFKHSPVDLLLRLGITVLLRHPLLASLQLPRQVASHWTLENFSTQRSLHGGAPLCSTVGAFIKLLTFDDEPLLVSSLWHEKMTSSSKAVCSHSKILQWKEDVLSFSHDCI